MEKCVYIKFCQKNEKNVYQMLLATCRRETMSQAHVFELFQRFKEGIMRVESDESENVFQQQ